MNDCASLLLLALAASCALGSLGCGSIDGVDDPLDAGAAELDAAAEIEVASEAGAEALEPDGNGDEAPAEGSAPSLDDRDGGADCPPQSSSAFAAGSAKSGSFEGGDVAYFLLYGTPCQAPGECAAACESAGGTMSSCEVGSQCVATALSSDGSMHCLPPTYWRNAAAAVSETKVTATAAELTLVTTDFHDSLVMTGFNASIPENATVTGIEIDVRRNADDAFAVDDSIRILKDGSPVGVDHRQPGAWPRELTYATYGGRADTWGDSWSPADFRSAGFGIAIAPKYTGLSGNDRAHVDSARATIFYTVPCD